ARPFYACRERCDGDEIPCDACGPQHVVRAEGVGANPSLEPRIRTAGRPGRLYIVFVPPMPATNIAKFSKALAERAKDGSHWLWLRWQYATARVDRLL